MKLGLNRRCQAALEAKDLFGLFGEVVSQCVGLMIQGPDLALHPGVELLIGIFVAQEVLHFLGIVDLFLLVGDFLIGDIDPDLLGQDLLVDVLDFVAGDIGLLDAVLQLAQEAGLATGVGR